MQYELFYLVGDKNESQLDAIRAEVVEILTAEGAKLDEQEFVEKRKLAYEIKHQSRGTYITRRFDLPEVDFWADESNSEKEFGIKAIVNKLNLHTGVLRSMVLKTDELPELGTKEARKARELSEKKNEKPAAKKERVGGPTRTERPAPAKRIETKVEAKKEEAPLAGQAKAEVKKETSSIDEKLEEILNI